ncbi:MAG: hypothetical protein ACI4BD_08935 [Paludibacteraceae bacterium]
MKKFFMAFLAVATVAMVGCKTNNTPDTPDTPDKPTVTAPTADDLAEYIEEGKYVVAVQFKETVCNDIVWVGTYLTNETGGWVEDPAQLLKMEALNNFEGWYVVAVPSLLNEDGTLNNAGKPVQLTSDGKFSWDYQTGDEASWTLVSGTVNIEAGYSGEANLSGYDPANGPIVMISEYFKNHNSPCVEAVTHDYTVIAKVPAGYDPYIIGDFNGWATGVAMELQADGSYKYQFNDAENHGFKLKGDADTWDNEILHRGTNADTGEEEWQTLNNVTLGAETTITLDYSGADYKWAKSE